MLLGPHTRTRIFLLLIFVEEDEEAAWEEDAIGAADPDDIGFRRLEPAITFDQRKERKKKKEKRREERGKRKEEKKEKKKRQK